LIRHLETTWNEKGLFQGSKEGKISRAGKIETKKFVFDNRNTKIDLIYCANNRRCGYLAKILSKFHPEAKIKIDNRLNERSFGNLEGLPERVFAVNTRFKPNAFVKRYKWRPKGGESLEQVAPRVKSFLNDLAVYEKWNKIVFIITSGGIIKLILYILKLKDLKDAVSIKTKSLEVFQIPLIKN